MSYTADDTLANDPAFQAKVKQSMVKAALAISSEPETTKNVVDSKRNSLAKNCLNDPQSYVQRFTNAAIQAGALTSSSTDPQIDGAIASAWNGIAGVTTQDKT